MVQQIYVKFGHTSICDYKVMMWSNFLMNSPVTIQDTEQAEEIYETIIMEFKVKTAISNPNNYYTDYIKVPPWVLK